MNWIWFVEEYSRSMSEMVTNGLGERGACQVVPWIRRNLRTRLKHVVSEMDCGLIPGLVNLTNRSSRLSGHFAKLTGVIPIPADYLNSVPYFFNAISPICSLVRCLGGRPADYRSHGKSRPGRQALRPRAGGVRDRDSKIPCHEFLGMKIDAPRSNG